MIWNNAAALFLFDEQRRVQKILNFVAEQRGAHENFDEVTNSAQYKRLSHNVERSRSSEGNVEN